MPQFTPPLAAHDCEIPAFAGMVFRGEWESGADFGIWHLRRRTFGGFAADSCVPPKRRRRYAPIVANYSLFTANCFYYRQILAFQ